MIGSLFLLDRQFPNVKQRTTALIHDRKLILYHNGKNPQVPLVIIDLLEATVIEGIEATSARFCIIEEQTHTKHEFEALDVQERSEWVIELVREAREALHFCIMYYISMYLNLQRTTISFYFRQRELRQEITIATMTH